VLAATLRRERAVMGAALLALVALCWAWLWSESARMSGVNMPDMADMQMSHMQMLGEGYSPWSGTLAAWLFLMWLAMMVGMMTPSAAPIILLYMGVARHAAGSGHRFASALWFLAGYLCAWATFSVLATLVHWLLESLALMTPAMQSASRPVSALVLLAAGIWQLLPAKDACLSRCRAPLSFIQQHGGFAHDRVGSMKLGLLHGWYCVGCCWLMMLVLLVVGVMNLVWIAGLMILVLVEKLAPGGQWIARAAGVAAVAAAASYL
jgi:predicted metal-binding membrane protein